MPVKIGELMLSLSANPGTVGASAVPASSPVNLIIPSTESVALLGLTVPTHASAGLSSPLIPLNTTIR